MDRFEEALSVMNEGEKQLYFLCEKYREKGYEIIPNALYERPDGGTSQIDLLMVSDKGIFVFEMKDYKGFITGNEYHENWTQHLKTNRGEKKYKFRNPIKQNENHIKTLKSTLNSVGIYLPFYNVIVFGLAATLGDISASIDIVTLENVDSIIEKYPTLAVGTVDIKGAAQLLMDRNIDSEVNRKKHLKFVNSVKVNPLPKNYRQSSKNTKEVEHKNKIKGLLNDVPLARKVFIVFLFFFSIFLIKNLYTILFMLIGSLILLRQNRLSGKRWVKATLSFFALAVILGGMITGLTRTYPSDEYKSNIPTTKVSSVQIADTTTSVSTTVTNNQTKLIMDENKNVNSSNTVIPKESEPTESIVSKQVAKFINLGSKTDDVYKLIGTPDEVNDNKLVYGNSCIIVNNDGEVIGWHNFHNVLIEYLAQPMDGAEKIFMGSPKQDVMDVLGAPALLDESYMFSWKYNGGTIWFDENEYVIGWHNVNNSLSLGLATANPAKGKFYLGSTSEDVYSILGAPSYLDYKNLYRWNYNSSYIDFDVNHQVVGWSSHGTEIADGLPGIEEGASEVYLGSLKDEVIKAMGAPTSILVSDPNKWNWGAAYIIFNDENKVISWANASDKLVALRKAKVNATKIDIGSTKDDVINALGCPPIYSEKDKYEFKWGYAHITFDENELVNGWSNYQDKLKVAFSSEIPGASIIDIGSSKEDVAKRMGMPNRIDAKNPNIWIWGNTQITFDEQSKVIGWFSNNNELKEDLYAQVDEALPFTIGSTIKEVMNAQGAPNRIDVITPNKYMWGNASVIFDDDGLVVEFYNYNGILVAIE